MKLLTLLLIIFNFLAIQFSTVYAKPGSIDPDEINTIINENTKEESGLRKTIQHSSGFQKDKLEEKPSFRPNKRTREELTDNVAVSIPSEKPNRKKKNTNEKHLKSDSSGERISQELNDSDL